MSATKLSLPGAGSDKPGCGKGKSEPLAKFGPEPPGLATGDGAELGGGLEEGAGLLNLLFPGRLAPAGPGMKRKDSSAATTLCSAQKATSHLIGRAPFRCEGLGWESIDRRRGSASSMRSTDAVLG